MTKEAHFSARCPSCGAPLSLSGLAFGIVRCEHCGVETALRALDGIDPSIVARYELQARASRRGSLVAATLRQVWVSVCCTAAGASLAGACFSFGRLPIEHAVVWPLLAGASAVAALAWKRRLFAALIALSVGLLTAAKPVLGTMAEHSPFSPPGLLFLIPGLVLLILGAASLSGIKRGETRGEGQLLRPTVAGIVGLLIGAGLVLALFGGKTNRKVLETEAAFLKQRDAQYEAFAARIAAESEPPPLAPDAPLSPRPVWVGSRQASNTDFVSITDLSRRFSGDRSRILYLGLKSPLSVALRHYRDRYPYDDWRHTPELAQAVALARRARYLVVYHFEELVDHQMGRCLVWMFDLSTDRLLLRREVAVGVSYSARRDLFMDLEGLTGGTFREATD